MKKIVFCILIFVGTLFAQVGSFNVYEMKVFDNSTNEIVDVIETDIIIQLTNDALTIIGKTALSWKLSGPVYNSDKSSLYSYATDQDGMKCRVWLKVYDDHCAFGIEYSDYSILYSCYLPE
jgi:hypothetical protein